MGQHRAKGLPKIGPPGIPYKLVISMLSVMSVIFGVALATEASPTGGLDKSITEVAESPSPTTYIPATTDFRAEKLAAAEAAAERIAREKAAQRASRKAERIALEKAKEKAAAEARAAAEAEAERKRKAAEAHAREHAEAEAAAKAQAEKEAAQKAAGISNAACPQGTSIESGLVANGIKVYRAVCAAFPDVGPYGGYRADADSYHNTGQAVDIMVSGDRGWEVANYVWNNRSALGVREVIYAQKIITVERAGEGWRWMEDRGSTTANHYDHVHVSVY